MRSMKPHLEHDSNPAAPCRRLRLAQGSVAHVEECSCGVLQLHLGAVTLRFTPQAFDDLAGTVASALAAYRDLHASIAEDEVNVFRNERGEA